jgi:murein DD-endopeptidase MepM/ murein hydrolase activator NlpD
MDQGKHFDGLTVAAIGIIFLMGFGLLRDAGVFNVGAEEIMSANSAAPAQALATMGVSGKGGEKAQADSAAAADQIDADAIAAPYDHFIVTQGLHGAEYGHMAIDISAGKGATIKSPINGTVTNLYIDDWGNPSLMIENEHYAVELLHGLFSVKIGDKVSIGQPIGKESNQGNTVDGAGRSCAGRDCGYHTHINVYDKKLGRNINPLTLFNIQAN